MTAREKEAAVCRVGVSMTCVCYLRRNGGAPRGESRRGGGRLKQREGRERGFTGAAL